MKETLQHKILRIIEQLDSRMDIIRKRINECLGKEDYSEAFKLATRLDVLKETRRDLHDTIIECPY